MSNQIKNISPKKYDLERRTAVLGELVIKFCIAVTKDTINASLVDQVVRSATSVGANYMEADGAGTKKEFQHRMSLCKREAKETMHWIRMLAVSNSQSAPALRPLWKEAHELVLIFSSIVNKSKHKN